MIHSMTTHKDTRIKSFNNCNTRYLVYIITCELCSLQYVGCTTCRLRDRLYHHLYDIQKNHAINVAKHWNEHHNKDVASLSIQGVEKVTVPKRGGDKFRILCKK